MLSLRLLGYSFPFLCVLLISILVMAQSRRGQLATQTNAPALDQGQRPVQQQRQSVRLVRSRTKRGAAQPDSSPASVLSFAPFEGINGSFGNFAESAAVADLNGDGKPDFVVVNNICDIGVALGCSPPTVDGTVGVLRSGQTVLVYDSGGYEGSSIAVADVDGDGKPDIVVTNQCVDLTCAAGTDGVVGVRLGNGDGTFQAVETYDSGAPNAVSVAIGDLNGDGKPDLVVGNFCNQTG